MDPTRIRLRPDCLEDRLTPAITPTDVFGALERTELFRDALGFISNDITFLLDAGKQEGTKAIVNVAAQQSAVDFGILAEFFAALQNQIVTNPAQAGVLLPFLGGVGATQFQALVNQGNATFLSNALANVSIAPPTATPPTTGQTDTSNAIGQTTNLGQTDSVIDQAAILDALNNDTSNQDTFTTDQAVTGTQTTSRR
jgi:hypothetical protein